jgi:chromosome segregation ATPase
MEISTESLGPAPEDDEAAEERHLAILLKQNAELLYQVGLANKRTLDDGEETIKIQIESKTRELKNAQKKEKQYKKANAHLKRKLEEIGSSDRAEAMQKAVHEKQRRIRELLKENRGLSNIQRAQTSRIKKHEAMKDELPTRLGKLQEELRVLKDKLARQEKREEEYTSRMKKAQERLDEYAEEKKKLEAQLQGFACEDHAEQKNRRGQPVPVRPAAPATTVQRGLAERRKKRSNDSFRREQGSAATKIQAKARGRATRKTPQPRSPPSSKPRKVQPGKVQPTLSEVRRESKQLGKELKSVEKDAAEAEMLLEESKRERELLQKELRDTMDLVRRNSQEEQELAKAYSGNVNGVDEHGAAIMIQSKRRQQEAAKEVTTLREGNAEGVQEAGHREKEARKRAATTQIHG